MADEGWVRIYHPDQVDETPNPDDPADVSKFALATREAFEAVWEPRGFVDLDPVLEAKAAEEQAARDQTAADAEASAKKAAPSPRKRT